MATEKTHPPAWKEILSYGNIILEGPLSKSQFVDFSNKYPDLIAERESNGSVKIMSPVKKGSGRLESLIQIYVGIWSLEGGGGEVYSSSTGIELSDGSIKSPDCAWISQISSEANENEFLQIIPDLIVEIKSSSDSIIRLQDKMQNVWMANGTKLGWLIDPYGQKAWIYRNDGTSEMITDFEHTFLEGEQILPGLSIPLDKFIL